MSVMQKDRYGLPITTTSSEAAEAFREGIDGLLASWHGADVAMSRALEKDHEFPLALATMALFMTFSFDQLRARQMMEQEVENVTKAKAMLAKATMLVEQRGTDREKSHVKIIRMYIHGWGNTTSAAALAHIEQWPRDAVILQLLLGAFGTLAFSGIADHDQARVDLTDQLAKHYGDDWWFLTFRGWALVENHHLDAGRAMCERSMQMRYESANGSHNLAHAMFEQGAHAEGAAFLKEWMPICKPENMLHSHLSWHAAWLALEHGDVDGALRVYLENCAPGKSLTEPTVVLTDGASLLWRLRAYGHAVPDVLWSQLQEFGKANFPEAGHPFVDVHMACIAGATGDMSDFVQRGGEHERLLACNALRGGKAIPTLCQAMVAFGQGDFAQSFGLLESVRDDVVRIGGSGAQRTLIEDTMILAAMKAGKREAASKYLNRLLDRRPSARDEQWKRQCETV